jgi:hypothetical protein
MEACHPWIEGVGDAAISEEVAYKPKTCGELADSSSIDLHFSPPCLSKLILVSLPKLPPIVYKRLVMR